MAETKSQYQRLRVRGHLPAHCGPSGLCATKPRVPSTGSLSSCSPSCQHPTHPCQQEQTVESESPGVVLTRVFVHCKNSGLHHGSYRTKLNSGDTGSPTSTVECHITFAQHRLCCRHSQGLQFNRHDAKDAETEEETEHVRTE